MDENLRFVFTGGPGAGKTTVLGVLRSRGFCCVPEVARKLIQDRIREGLSPRPSAVEFAAQILAADVAQYDQCVDSGQPVFFDRGLGDALGMALECGLRDRESAIAEYGVRPYNSLVFFFPPWEAIYRPDSERDQSLSEVIATSERVRAWYRSLGAELVDVPFGTADERADFVLRFIAAR